MNKKIKGAADSFSALEAARIAEVPYQTIDYWARSGFIVPRLAVAKGRGTERRYAFDDLVALRMARALRDAGASMQSLRKVMIALREMESSLSEARVIVVGKEVALVSSCDEVVGLLEKPGQMAFPAFVIDRPSAIRAVRKRIPKSGTAPREARAAIKPRATG